MEQAQGTTIRSSSGAVLAAGCFALGLWAFVFVRSENLHSTDESISFDRLMLGLRWWSPQGSRWDLNFPLGTHVVMGLPHALGLDPVAWGRGVSAVGAGLAALFLFALLRPLAGRLAAAAVAALVCVPGFLRGAVVVGEESLYTALLLLVLVALVRGRERRSWLVLACLAANATVLFRLDAMTMLPGLALAAFAVHGAKGGALFALGASLSSWLHLGLGWFAGGSWNGDPLGFAHLARGNISRNAPGFAGLGSDSLLASLARELGGLPLLAGWPLLLFAAAGVVWGARSKRPEGAVLAIAAGWLLLADLILVSVGAMEPRTVRYLVPLTSLLVGAACLGVHGIASLRARALAAVLLGVGLLANLPRIAEQAGLATLPVGLGESARFVAERVGTGRVGAERVLVGEQHPTFVILGGLDWRAVDVLAAGSPEDQRASVVGAALAAGGARWLVQVDGNPPDASVEELRRSGMAMHLMHETACCRVWRVGE